MLHVAKRPPKPDDSFSYCFDIYAIRDKGCIGYCCNRINLLEKLEIAAKAGWRAVELWHTDIVNHIKSGVEASAIKSKLDNLSLKVPSYKVIGNWMEVSDADFAKNFSGFVSTMETAKSIGAESIILKMIDNSFYGTPPSIDQVVQRYEKLLVEAEKINIRPSIEFMATARCWNTIEQCYDVLDRVSSPLACLVLDTYHLWRNTDKDFLKFEQSLHRLKPEKISVIHYSDVAKDIPQKQQKDNDRRMPGDGLLNLGRFIELLKQIGYKGTISLNNYDQNLWNQNPTKVATEGWYKTQQSIHKPKALVDSKEWQDKQTERCLKLWAAGGNNHLDPRLEANNRQRQLEEALGPLLEGKKVLDFKCGFAPLAKYVSIGFDAFQGCIDYLEKEFPAARWICKSDQNFSETFDEQIDVLMHLGLGDSDTEVKSNFLIRQKCKPKYVILECAATPYGQVDNTKPGSSDRWNMLKKGLQGKEIFMKTDMSHRANRLLFIGEVNE